ncbi:MAG: hypothetical protein B6D62_00420 [Candidatus Cloacimonas sp. 4484_275]|nr:MAG: hypothetical protein B6D62_00420 [Candidatus Cloacimonas sp. 4484_275]
MIEKTFFQRRQKLADLLNANEMVVIFAASMPNYPRKFLQDNNFLYFTGLEIPEAVFVLKKVKNKIISELFIERGIPEREVWDGKKMTKEEAAELSGIEKVFFLDEFSDKISAGLSETETCFVSFNYSTIDKPLDKQQEFMRKSRNVFPQVRFANAVKLIRNLRVIKDEWEINQMKKAIEVTGMAILEIYQKAKPGMKEYELEAILQYHILKNGLKHQGFLPIIAAGKNATTLHYIRNDSEIGKNDLVLLDVGAACNNYSADISRTFPVAGKFTDRQKAVYREVLNIQKEIIEMVKPRVGLVELNKKTNELIAEALIRLKLISDKKDFRKYYMHSVSHHLGMDTHDVGARDSVLEAGNVITVEPGIYIPEEGIGVRIEDDILVTENGYEILSADIPKEIEDLENLK